MFIKELEQKQREKELLKNTEAIKSLKQGKKVLRLT